MPARDRRSRSPLAAPAAVLAVCLWAVAPAAAADPSPMPAAGTSGAPAIPAGVRLLVKPVFHVAVKTQLVSPGSDGHRLGDLRVLPATELYDADGLTIGHLNALLVTTSVDYPAVGDEVRMSRLDFVLERDAESPAGGGDQVIVSGSGYYPGDQSTIAVGAVLVRPIIGGSGAYAGATGWAESDHLDDGSWRHTLHIILPTQP
ncbi:MAG: hypothetical protein ACKOTZ_03890 [Chloroflexota bacterium]